MITVTFTKTAGLIVWGWLGLFGRRQFCQSCGQRVKPSNVGAFKKLDDGTTAVWHNRLPCTMSIFNSEGESRG